MGRVKPSLTPEASQGPLYLPPRGGAYAPCALGRPSTTHEDHRPPLHYKGRPLEEAAVLTVLCAVYAWTLASRWRPTDLTVTPHNGEQRPLRTFRSRMAALLAAALNGAVRRESPHEIGSGGGSVWWAAKNPAPPNIILYSRPHRERAPAVTRPPPHRSTRPPGPPPPGRRGAFKSAPSARGPHSALPAAGPARRFRPPVSGRARRPRTGVNPGATPQTQGQALAVTPSSPPKAALAKPHIPRRHGSRKRRAATSGADH